MPQHCRDPAFMAFMESLWHHASSLLLWYTGVPNFITFPQAVQWAATDFQSGRK